jgi:hypothetical protein
MSSYEYDVNTLKQICPIFVEEQVSEDQRASSLTYDINQYEASLMKTRDDYMSKVEQGNLYIDKLLALEEKYFTQKYGPEIYNYMLQQRKRFMDTKNAQECKTSVFADSQVTAVTEDMAYLVPNMIDDLSGEFQQYKLLQSTNLDSISDKVKINNKEINENIFNLYGETSVNQRKIEYRHEEIMKVNVLNNMITMGYYFVLIALLLYLVYKEQLELGNKWFIYVLLILFPILIYPFIFYYIKKLFSYLSNHMEIHGPKNAFLNQKLDMEFLDKHDI